MLSIRVSIVVLMALCCATIHALAGTNTLVSITQAAVQGNDASRYCSVSGDGRYVAFISDATNLVPGDTNSCADVFLKDCDTGEIELVTVGLMGAAANAGSFDCTISSNGRYVAFRSDATNLVDGDTNGVLDVFVRDLQTDTTERVSVGPSGVEGDAAAQGNWSPSGAGSYSGLDISGDGRYVAFESYASNLVAFDTNSQADVFVRDRTSGTTTRVSRRWDGTESRWAYGPPAISDDGRYVAYTSADNHMVEGMIGAGYQVYVYDTQTQTNVMASKSTIGSIANAVSDSPDLSADGRYVAFSSKATNLVPDTSAVLRQVYVKDLQTGALACVSVDNEGAMGWGDSRRPSISGDGTRISFESLADNLFPDGGALWIGVFLHDRSTQMTYWASPTTGGWANGAAMVGRVSLDGRYVGYHAGASNLVADDTNSADDAFRFDFGPIAYQPDGLIYNWVEYIGDDIYNADGTDQTYTRRVAPRRIVTYRLRFSSDANAMDCLKITGTAGSTTSGGWRVRYRDPDGADITAAVTGAGWTTPSLRPGQYRELELDVIAPEGAVEDSEMPVLVTATSTADGSKQDTVKALTICRVVLGVDGVIHNGSAFIGQGVVNADGTGQTHSQNAYATYTVGYEMVFTNGGNTYDGLNITGTAGNGNWSVQYLEYWSGSDITAQVTGAGWQTAPLVPQGTCRLRVYVTPLAGTAPTSSLAVPVTGTSVGDGTKADTVKAQTTCVPLYRPDALIHDGAAFIGDGVYNTNGTGQTRTRMVNSGTAATYLLWFQNDGTVDDGLRITGTAGNSRWSVQYLEYWSGTDITADVTGGGWQPAALAPGGSVRLRLLVTPLATALGGTPLNVYVTAGSATSPTARDTVKAATTCIAVYRPDALIFDGTVYAGDDIYNTTGLGQSCSQATTPRRGVYYYPKLYNDGNTVESFVVRGSAGNAQWTVTYLDFATGADITADVTGAGWQTPVLAPRGNCRLKVLVMPAATTAPGDALSIVVTATSVGDANKKDAVKGTTTVQ